MKAPEKLLQNKITIVLLVVMVLVYLTLRGCGLTGNKSYDKREKAFRHNKIEYTEHAKCRMKCRKITEKEIEEVLDKGEINYRKTDKNASPCPKYALEDYVDGKKVRVIVGDCDEKAVIVSVIDLDNEFKCACQGDENN